MRTSKIRGLLSFGVGLLLLLASNESHAEALLDLRDERPSRLHILAIGINTYSGTIPPLRYAWTDAIAVVEALKQSFKGTVQLQELLDEQATREAIEVAMERVIADAKPHDLFVLYFGGSSQVGLDKEFYLLPVNVTERQGDLSSQAMSSNLLKAWLSRIQANKQLVILDSCDGKQPMASVISRIEEEDIRGARLSDRRVMIVGTDGLAMEDEKLKHGVLTFHLLQCLTGAADVLPKNGVITARELDVCIRGQATLGQESGIEQAIVTATVGRDFVVMTVSGSRGADIDEIATGDNKSRPLDGGLGRDYALLIAIDDYDAWKHLSNPIHDARAVAADLREIYGFETELVENPTLNQMYEVFEKYMKREFSLHDQLVIFIAGHGTYKNDTREGFLITKDSKAQREDRWGNSFLSHARLGQIVDHFNIGHVLLILDACFGGTFDQRIAEAGHRGDDEYPDLSAEEFKNRKLKYKTRRYLTSGGTEYVPDGRPGAHSPFARKLLEALRSYGGKDGYLTIGNIVQYVEKVTPEPRAGDFGSHDPGGDLVMLHHKTTR